ncbi:MAG: hypothetical protein P4M08_09185 [Oligoflexia bacterium]|nr:hypothetical protein [Oligoflexia bacterium]
MRIGPISVVIAGLAILLSVSLMPSPGFSAPAATLRQHVDQLISGLDQTLSSAPMMERFKVLSQAETEIKKLRASNPRQSEDDEIYFDTYLAMLAEIPRDSRFKKARCPEYSNRLLADFEPTAGAEPQNPAVEAGLKTLSALCN